MTTTAQNPAVKQYQEQRKAIDEANAKSQREMDEAKPTLTQEENDLAKLGAFEATPKEDTVNKNMKPSDPSSYPTKDMKSK